MNADLVTRVNMLKAAMGLNVEQLASELGISRATLNNATKASNPRRLSDAAAKRLKELEVNHGLDKTDNFDPLEGPAPIKTDCRHCRDKDAEISYLRDQLKAANDNLAAMIDLMKTKKECVIPASGVCYNPGKPNSTKGA